MTQLTTKKLLFASPKQGHEMSNNTKITYETLCCRKSWRIPSLFLLTNFLSKQLSKAIQTLEKTQKKYLKEACRVTLSV